MGAQDLGSLGRKVISMSGIVDTNFDHTVNNHDRIHLKVERKRITCYYFIDIYPLHTFSPTSFFLCYTQIDPRNNKTEKKNFLKCSKVSPPSELHTDL